MVLAEVQVSASINRDPLTIFTYIANADTHIRWITGLTYVSASGMLNEGQEYSAIIYNLGQRMEVQNRVTKLVPGELLELTNQTGPISYRIAYSTKKAARGTKVTIECQVKSDSTIFKFAEPALDYFVRNKLKSDLDNLEVLLEHDVTS
jgi:hypothetical protein